MIWVRMNAGILDHPKIKTIPKRDRYDLIGWFMCLVGWSEANLTDGQIPAELLRSGDGRHVARAARAQRALLIHLDGDECARCARPTYPGGAVIHDFADYQTTKAQVTAKREAVRGRVDLYRQRHRNAVTGALHAEVGQVSVTRITTEQEHVLGLVSQLTYQPNKSKTTTPENSHLTWERWREIAGGDLDALVAEANAWLDRCYTAGMPDDPAGAWLGWLRVAASRHAATAALTEAATVPKAPGCADCTGGWRGEDDAGRPIPCPNCRPNVIRMRYGTGDPGGRDA